MERQKRICSLIQADRPGWDDRLFSTIGVLENHKSGANNEVVRELVPQHLREIADLTMGEFANQMP